MSIVPYAFSAFLIAIVTTENCEDVPGGIRQSPIDIRTLGVIITKAPPLKWSRGYNQVPESMFLENDGHTLRLTVTPSATLRLSSGMLDVPYEFTQLHFHWGDSDDRGSEHKVNGRSYPLEMHVVHSQSVSGNVDANVVVAYFFRVARRSNRGLQNLLDVALQAAENRNATLNVKPFALEELVSNGPFSYYTYKGSLTTPPYSESVTWIIAATAIPISDSQLRVFREAANLDDGLLNNYRCLQKLNDRVVRLVV